MVGYPTQFPSVSMVDWETGAPNARFRVLELLKNNFGPGDKLVAGGMTQTAEIHSGGGGYLSQDDTRVHFGLGSATRIDKLEIHWPSGLVETLTNLDADKHYNVLEGKGIVAPEVARPKPVKQPQQTAPPPPQPPAEKPMSDAGAH